MNCSTPACICFTSLGTTLHIPCGGRYHLPSGPGQVWNSPAAGIPGRSEYCGCWYQGESWNEKGIIKSRSIFSTTPVFVFSISVLILILMVCEYLVWIIYFAERVKLTLFVYTILRPKKNIKELQGILKDVLKLYTIGMEKWLLLLVVTITAIIIRKSERSRGR